MKKKILILILMLFLLCGCTAEVNVDISSNGIKEEVIITAYQDSYNTKEQLKTSFRDYIPAFGSDVIIDAAPDEAQLGINYYSKRLEDLGNGYKFIYNYDYKIGEYGNATTLKRGFRSPIVQRDTTEKTILLSTDNGGLLFFEQYPSLDEVKVNITSNYLVKEHNADYVNGNVYTWVLSRSANNKNIYMLINEVANTEEDDANNDQNVVNDDEPKKEYDNDIQKFMNENPFLIVISGIVIFLIFVIIVTKLTKVKYK